MNSDQKTKIKIEALLRKTVKNGATPDEEASALLVAKRLMSSMKVAPDTSPPRTHDRTMYNPSPYEPPKPPTKSKEEKYNNEMDKFRHFRSLGTLSANAEKIDWDIIAGTILTQPGWQEYIRETTGDWDKTYYIIGDNSITETSYRRICYNVLRKIYKDENVNASIRLD